MNWDNIKALTFVVFKFGMAGVAAVCIDFGITWLLKEKARINKYIANSTGFTISAVANFFINKFWTFSDPNPEVLQQFLKFSIVIGFGLLINNGFLWLLHKKQGIKFYYAKILAILCTTLWNFIGNYLFTFTLQQ
jgi:putative flippase GtrA